MGAFRCWFRVRGSAVLHRVPNGTGQDENAGQRVSGHPKHLLPKQSPQLDGSVAIHLPEGGWPHTRSI